MLNRDCDRIVARYLVAADRLLPGRITGFYIVGSAALGAWRAGCSDIDFVGVVEGDPTDRDVRRLRVLHALGNTIAIGRALLRAQPTFPGTMNGVFVLASDLSRPVTQIRPLASHSGPSFQRGRGFDANPVTWKVLAERGITMRGAAPNDLGLDPQPSRLRAWNLDQLHGHWRSFADKAMSGRPPSKPLVPPHRAVTARLLGPPRLHHTIATGEVITKEAGGEYALDTFVTRWHPLIRTALGRRTGQPTPARFRLEPDQLPPLAGEFILEVIADADHL